MTAADGTKIAERKPYPDYEIRLAQELCVSMGECAATYHIICQLQEIERLKVALSRAEERERVLREALEYYAADMEHNKFYIVTAPDRAFISDFADWGGKARAALATPAPPKEHAE